MHIVFRVDVSEKIGTGHFMRCLTLANALLEKSVSVYFVCRHFPGNYQKLSDQKGIKIYWLPSEVEDQIQDARLTVEILQKINHTIDWLILDSYHLNLVWEKYSRAHIKKLMVIDDLHTSHDCDLLVSQNYPTLNYDELVPSTTQLCLGLTYVLLRDEFYHQRQLLRERTGVVKRILIAFGGGDPTHSTLTSLQTIKKLKLPDLMVDIVVSSMNPDKELVRKECESNPNWHYHYQVDNIATLMHNADLSLGSGGSMNWERCFLGLPAIVNIVADNQVRTTDALGKIGAIINVGENNDAAFYDSLIDCLSHPDKTKKMSTICLELMPHYNKTGAQKIVEKLLQFAPTNESIHHK